MTDEKRSQILDAAMSAFMRHGYRRVTMGDIAAEAGMSRPALYLVFPGKEEIFKAAVAQFIDTGLRGIREGIDELPTLAEKLAFTFEVWLVRPFELIHNSPDAKEVVDMGHGFAADVFADGYARFERLLAAMLESEAGELGRLDISVGELTHLVTVALRGFKQAAGDVTELRQLITSLIRVVLAVLHPRADPVQPQP